MIAHLSIGARDIGRARRFYDAALEPLGYTCLSSDEGSLGYGAKAAEYWINRTDQPVPADDRSGLHICFNAPDRDAVDAFHKAALKSGGRDNGKPGLRAAYGPNYYAAFVVDPEGYRIEAWCGKKS